MIGRKCKDCDAQLVFIKTDADKPMPVELPEVTIMTAGGAFHIGYVVHVIGTRCPGSDKARRQPKLL